MKKKLTRAALNTQIVGMVNRMLPHLIEKALRRYDGPTASYVQPVTPRKKVLPNARLQAVPPSLSQGGWHLLGNVIHVPAPLWRVRRAGKAEVK